MSKIIRLQSAEGEIFNVDMELIKCCTNIMGLLEFYEVVDALPLYSTSSATLRNVLAWAEYHVNDPEPEEDQENEEEVLINADDISSWDADFLDVDSETLSDLIHAAECLGIKALLATCKAVEKMPKYTVSDDIAETLNI